ncbi:AraC family transcriptional regulator [Azospirillum sp. TSO35-2]|uniref:helix-turn-helix domain-containing protein n=1 Tax=Azospirillum sp. TSO35-2 TaxID=716796 RepID=UPI000D612D82|nr:AraC family transcriptional regulator [Azospirillum sp. TSO35-2]PWC31198.1 transcriptional regulator [Azospirillum sp. TSO35-2]
MATAASSNADLGFIPTPDRPCVLTRSIGKGMVGIARVRYELDELGMLDEPAIEDAYLLSHHLSNFHSDIWVDGKRVGKPGQIGGLTTIHDFRHRIGCRMHTAFDTLVFHMPRVVLETVFPESQKEQLEDLRIRPSACLDDPTIAAMARAILPAIERSEQISLLFLDHVACALATHIVAAYGTLAPVKGPGNLAPWQERRVKEMIAARLEGDVRLADLAAECRLSVGHFVRAFRRTTNTTPHQWLLQQRVEHAKTLMRAAERSLADIALDCGFADQSHFTRTFSRLTGISPGAWRRHNGSETIVPTRHADNAAPDYAVAAFAEAG